MAMQKVRLEIGGSVYVLSVDGDTAYYEELGRTLNDKIAGMLEANDRLSVTMAAVLSALDYLDELRHASDGADNLRNQLKSYLEDAMSAKETAENAARELQELRVQLEKSRMECDRLRREVGYMRGQDL